MALIEGNWRPERRELRQFGIICLFAFPAIGWFWGAASAHVTVLAGIGAAFAILGILTPNILRPVYVAFMVVSTPIGLVVGEAAMLLIYLGIFFPMSLLFWVFRRDALNLTLDREVTSYWTEKREPPHISHYYRQS